MAVAAAGLPMDRDRLKFNAKPEEAPAPQLLLESLAALFATRTSAHRRSDSERSFRSSTERVNGRRESRSGERYSENISCFDYR